MNKLLKVYLLETGRWIITREVKGVKEVIDFDLRMAKPRTGHRPPESSFDSHNNPDHTYPTVRGASSNKHYNQISIIGKSTRPRDRVVVENYTGPYPHYIYLADGETETLEDLTNAVVPDWIITETPEERATRERKENLVDWDRMIHKMARSFVENDKTYELAYDYAMSANLTPNPALRFDLRFKHHNVAAQVAAIAKAHRIKKIGMAKRLYELYKDPTTATPFDLNRNTKWESDRTYRAGDYEKKDGFTYWCLRNHTSNDENAPDVDVETWRKVLLNNIPSSFTYDVVSYKKKEGNDYPPKYDRIVTPKNVTINLETGDGILDYLHCIAQEFGYHDDFHISDQPPADIHDSDRIPNDHVYFFYGVMEKLPEWRAKTDEYELWTSKVDEDSPTGIVPDNKIYSAKVAHLHSSQKTDALWHTKADCLDLYSRFHDALRTHIKPEAQSPFLRSPGGEGY